MKDFFAFRKLVTPALIKVVFWIGVVWCLFAGGADIAKGGNAIRGTGLVFKGLGVFFLGPVAVRMFCELLMSAFSISDNLAAIRQVVAPQELIEAVVPVKLPQPLKSKQPQKLLSDKNEKKEIGKDDKLHRNNGSKKIDEDKAPLKSDLKTEIETIEAAESREPEEPQRIKV